MNVEKLFSRLFIGTGLAFLGYGVGTTIQNKNAIEPLLIAICCLLLGIIHYLYSKEN